MNILKVYIYLNFMITLMGIFFQISNFHDIFLDIKTSEEFFLIPHAPLQSVKAFYTNTFVISYEFISILAHKDTQFQTQRRRTDQLNFSFQKASLLMQMKNLSAKIKTKTQILLYTDINVYFFQTIQFSNTYLSFLKCNPFLYNPSIVQKSLPKDYRCSITSFEFLIKIH